MIKLMSTVLLVLLAATSFASTGGNSTILKFHMPEESVNGSFVIRVRYDEPETRKTEIMELWRSHGTGEFELVSRQPKFDAISQMLYRPGTYSYFVKVVRQNEDGAMEELATSAIKTIDVKVKHTNLLSGVF